MPIEYTVAAAILGRLEGFRDYPRGGGARRFVEALADASLSVAHANATVEMFDERFPTIREIRDVAFGLRETFVPKEPIEKQWEKEYGKPDPNWSRNLTGSYKEQKGRMLWQAIRDSLFYTEGPGTREHGSVPSFWQVAMKGHVQKHPHELASVREEIMRRGWEDVMKEDWANEVQAPSPALPPPAKRITQADIDALKNKSAVAVEEKPEDDPDRWE
jgi:hypothetical protein